MRVVRRLEPGLVDVERVAVLHPELATAQEPGPGPRLVAVLRLDLVERQRQVLVGRVQVLDQQREHLLVRGAEEVVAALAVLEPEEVVAVLGPPVRRLVGLAGQQRREVDLLGAHRVHLLADDVLDPAQHPVAERQPRVDARRRPADVAGPDEQPVARHLGVGGVVPQRPQEQRGHPQDGRGPAALGQHGASGGVGHARKAIQRAYAADDAVCGRPEGQLRAALRAVRTIGSCIGSRARAMALNRVLRVWSASRGHLQVAGEDRRRGARRSPTPPAGGWPARAAPPRRRAPRRRTRG